MTGIADTGFVVAFANRRDLHHGWACEQASLLREPLLTCEAVLSEAAFKLRDAVLVMEMVATGLLQLDFDLAANTSEIEKLARRYADREPDLADLCLVRMSELFSKLSVWTVDTDFLVYRKNRRQVIPVVMPPNLLK